MLAEKSDVSIKSLAPLGLTRRETEILFLMTRGKTNAGIGTVCGISPRTVKKHTENIYLKLSVENRTAAVRMTLETNFFNLH